MNVLTLANITVTAHGSTLLRDISLQVTLHEHLLLAGVSGAGKSTLLTTLMGGHIPSRGTYQFKGEEVTAHTISTVREQIAFIGQESILGAPSVHESLLLPFHFKANKHLLPTSTHLADVLESVHLSPDILVQNSDTVSGGEKQRLVIARALLLKKEIFLIDEATSTLDNASKQAVLTLFTQSPLTIISISHDSAWQALADRTLTLAQGEIVS